MIIRMFMILILLKSIFNMSKNNIGVNQKKTTWEINILKEININKTNKHISHPTIENNKNHDMTLETQILAWDRQNKVAG